MCACLLAAAAGPVGREARYPTCVCSQMTRAGEAITTTTRARNLRGSPPLDSSPLRVPTTQLLRLLRMVQTSARQKNQRARVGMARIPTGVLASTRQQALHLSRHRLRHRLPPPLVTPNRLPRCRVLLLGLPWPWDTPSTYLGRTRRSAGACKARIHGHKIKTRRTWSPRPTPSGKNFAHRTGAGE